MLIREDMVFLPYGYGGYQCKIELACGTISVRFGGHGVLTDKDGPYEVWYPGEDAPTPRETADDIREYIKQKSPN